MLGNKCSLNQEVRIVSELCFSLLLHSEVTINGKWMGGKVGVFWKEMREGEP